LEEDLGRARDASRRPTRRADWADTVKPKQSVSVKRYDPLIAAAFQRDAIVVRPAFRAGPAKARVEPLEERRAHAEEKAAGSVPTGEALRAFAGYVMPTEATPTSAWWRRQSIFDGLELPGHGETVDRSARSASADTDHLPSPLASIVPAEPAHRVVAMVTTERPVEHVDLPVLRLDASGKLLAGAGAADSASILRYVAGGSMSPTLGPDVVLRTEGFVGSLLVPAAA
jgi:hypothetical protein